MTMVLLDVNVLIALFDPAHVHHDLVHEWFAREPKRVFATCPTTENGFVRIVSSPAYPNISLLPQNAVESLRSFLAGSKKRLFWPDDVSLCDESIFTVSFLHGYKQVTDAYLLGLCKRHQGKLATLDRRISAAVVGERNTQRIELIA